MNKKGLSTWGTIAVVLILLVGLFSIVHWGLPKSYTQINPGGTGGETSLTSQTVTALTTGDTSTPTFVVKDQESSNIGTSVSAPLYVRDVEDGMLTDCDGVATSTSGTQCSTTRNTKLQFWAFNDTGATRAFYAQLTPYKVNGNTYDPMNYDLGNNAAPSIEAWVRRSVGSMRIIMKNDDTGVSSTNSGLLNISASSAKTDTEISWIKIENNDTYSAFNLAKIFVDIKAAPTNISDIDISGSASVSGQDISSVSIKKGSLLPNEKSRISGQDDFVFDVDSDSALAGNQPLLLEAADYIKTGIMSVTIKGTGCIGAGDNTETIQVNIADDACYRSRQNDPYRDMTAYPNARPVVCDQIANDATTPGDVGTSDFESYIVSCTSTGL